MKTSSRPDPLAERPRLDFSKGVRGRYANLTNLVSIAPDLLDTFPDAESVDKALRGLKELATRTAKQAS